MIKKKVSKMNDLTKRKIKKYIKKNFPIAIKISKISPIYLIGGTLRDIESSRKPKDLDFVVLDDTNQIVKSVISKYNLKFEINKLGGYKIFYNDIIVDLWSTNDLLKSIEYNIEGLFYDVKNDLLIPFGYYDAIENGLRQINPNNNILNDEKKHNRKVKFENYIKSKNK